jgi:hypothetical protein
LQDPPPPGYTLYTGIGEPVSDSAPVKSKTFQLVCEHFKCVPIRLGASYAGFINGIDRSLGFQTYPRDWDSYDYEQVDFEASSIRVIGFDTTWTREQRDAWLRQPSDHEWNWRQITVETIAMERPATRSLKVPGSASTNSYNIPLWAAVYQTIDYFAKTASDQRETL